MANMLHVNHETPISLEHAFVDENAVSKSIIASRPLPSKYPCAVNPCSHGGVCVTDTTQPSGHRCDCPSGYKGLLCTGMLYIFAKNLSEYYFDAANYLLCIDKVLFVN